MGYFLLLLLLMGSLHAMDELGSDQGGQEKKEQLLDKIKEADQDGVRQCLLQGERPTSIPVDLEQDSKHHVNDFMTAALRINNADKRFEILRLLLEHGVNPNHSVRLDGEQKKMPLLSYVIGRFGDTSEDVCLLVAHGARVAEEDFCGLPPLFHARKLNCPNVIKTLLASNAPSIGVGDVTLSSDAHQMLEDFAGYREQHSDEIADILGKIDNLRVERRARERAARSDLFSVDHGPISRSPRK